MKINKITCINLNMILTEKLAKKYISNGGTRLNLSYKNIIFIEYNAFQSFKDLKNLRLDCNQLKDLDHRIFENLTKLENLYIDYNQLERIDYRIFKNLVNLKSLYLSGNKLKKNRLQVI